MIEYVLPPTALKSNLDFRQKALLVLESLKDQNPELRKNLIYFPIDAPVPATVAGKKAEIPIIERWGEKIIEDMKRNYIIACPIDESRFIKLQRQLMVFPQKKKLPIMAQIKGPERSELPETFDLNTEKALHALFSLLQADDRSIDPKQFEWENGHNGVLRIGISRDRKQSVSELLDAAGIEYGFPTKGNYILVHIGKNVGHGTLWRLDQMIQALSQVPGRA